MPAPPKSVLPMLGEALQTFGVPFVISDPTLRNTKEMWPGVIARVPDSAWPIAFEQLARTCRALVLIPGDSPGSMEEIANITHSERFRKTIVFVTPAIHLASITRYDGWDDPDAKSTAVDALRDVGGKVARRKQAFWDDLRLRLSERGLHLPPYRASGFLFVPGRDSSARRMVPLLAPSDRGAPNEELTVDHIRRAFDKILSSFDFQGTPVREALELLELMEREADGSDRTA